jgi:integrase
MGRKAFRASGLTRPVKGFRRNRADGTPYPTLFVDFVYRGRRVNRDSGCRTQKDVQQWAVEQKQAIDREMEAEGGSPLSIEKYRNLTVPDALEMYWGEHLKNARSAKADEYRTARLMRALNGVKLSEMRTAHVMQMVARMRDQNSKRGGKIAAATINRHLTILKAMHTYAADVWELDPPRVAWKKLHQKEPKRVIRAPTPEDVQLLVKYASPRLKPVILMAVLTGLRWAEIKNLKREQTNLARGEMILIGKGNKEVRLPLSSAVISLLSSIPPGNSPYWFDMRGFVRQWDVARRMAGLPTTRFHDLRHAFATWLAKAGTPTMEMQNAMRHSDISMSREYVDAESLKVLPYLERLGEMLKLGMSRNLLRDESKDSSSSEPKRSATGFGSDSD